MDDHDPLCPTPKCLESDGPRCDSTDHICQCELIAKVRADALAKYEAAQPHDYIVVNSRYLRDLKSAIEAEARADEREQAAQRVEHPDLHHEWCDLKVDERIKGTPNTGRCDCYHAACIAAARGEA